MLRPLGRLARSVRQFFQGDSRAGLRQRPEETWRPALESLEDRTLPATVFAVTDANQLFSFDSATPQTTTTPIAIANLVAGDAIVGIDFRPATGQLFALGVNGSTGHLYTLNTSTAQASQVGGDIALPTSTGASGVGTRFGFDFNPSVDRIRVVADTRNNFRLNPNNGTLAATDTALNGTPTPVIVGAAYDRNAGITDVTTLFGIDSDANSLVRQGGVDGTPSPDGGAITTIGTGFGFDFSDEVGFDIEGDASGGFASLQVAGVTSFYNINLSLGTAAAVNTIGAGTTTVRDIAVVQTGLKAVSALSAGETLTLTATGAAAGSYLLASVNGGAAVTFSGITSFTFLGRDLDDVLTINNPGGSFFAPASGVNFNGGTGADTLNIFGGTFTNATYNYTNANDGSIVLNTGGTSSTINYLSLSPITNTGTATNAVFNLPGTADNAFLEDDGSVGNNTSRLRSSTFEQTTFVHPTGSLTINAGTGDTLSLDLKDSLNAADVDIDGADDILAGSLTTTGDVTLVVTGGIEELGDDADADITADALTLSTFTGIGIADALEINANTLTADSDGEDGSDIVVTDTAGGIDIDLVDAGGANVTLSAVGGAVSDDDVDDEDIVAADLVLSGDGLGEDGNPLETAVTRLEADAGSGAAFIVNSGALTIGGIGSMVGVSASTGVEITASSPLVVSENIINDDNDVILTAEDSAAAGDNLTVNSGVTVQAVSGDVILQAGDDLTLQAGSTVQASGTITATGDFGDADAAGSILSINGTVTATSMAVIGGNDSDTFNVKPSVATPIDIDGDDPTPPATPGDVLNIDFTGVTGVEFTTSGEGAGSFTFTSHEDLTYTNIETLGPVDLGNELEVFVMRVYFDLLHRFVDPDGLDFWTDMLNAGTNRVDVAFEIQKSVEYRTLVVQQLFQQYLNRAGQGTEVDELVERLGRGAKIRNIAARIIKTQEYFEDVGDGTRRGFIQALFNDALDRDPTTKEEDNFARRLRGDDTRRDLAIQLFQKKEFQTNLINGYFQDFLGHDADADSLRKHRRALINGHNEQEIIAAIIGSDEYFNNQ